MKKIWLIVLMFGFGMSLVACDTSASIQEQSFVQQGTIFSTSDLAQYTGRNGMPAYIAVDGVVYDVSGVFINGMHQGMQLAGNDVSLVFASSPHSMALLATLPVMGTYDPNATTTPTNNPSNPTPGTASTLPVFTLTELAAFTGANGSTAYIAVNGVVYNVTNVFVDGMHQGMQLGGTDATAIFATSPHSASLLSSLSVVGSLEGYPVISDSTASNPSSNSCEDEDEYEDEEEDEDEHEDEHEDEDEYEDD
jgi:predicted heme/steroid binding protein